MEQAQQGNTVKVHYQGKLEDGTVFDSSRGREPLEFTIGEGRVIAGFEEAVQGMRTGETKVSRVPADQAYGHRRDDLVLELPRTQIPDELDVEVGQQLTLQKQDGQPIPVVVADLDEENVTLDANHPLAGEDLTFELELVEIA